MTNISDIGKRHRWKHDLLFVHWLYLLYVHFTLFNRVVEYPNVRFKCTLYVYTSLQGCITADCHCWWSIYSSEVLWIACIGCVCITFAGRKKSCVFRKSKFNMSYTHFHRIPCVLYIHRKGYCWHNLRKGTFFRYMTPFTNAKRSKKEPKVKKVVFRGSGSLFSAFHKWLNFDIISIVDLFRFGSSATLHSHTAAIDSIKNTNFPHIWNGIRRLIASYVIELTARQVHYHHFLFSSSPSWILNLLFNTPKLICIEHFREILEANDAICINREWKWKKKCCEKR